MRKAKPKKRVILPDPIYGDQKVSKFVNHLPYAGKKNISYEILYKPLEPVGEKMKDQELWKPDFGPETIHPTGGVTAIGARMPLVAFNINLDTSNVEIASEIAKKIRHIGGGYRYVKAMGVMLEDRNIAQVSMNLTNYEKSAVYRVFETVKFEARRYGVNVIGSEVIGLVPMAALIYAAEYYLQIENFDMNQVLETRLF